MLDIISLYYITDLFGTSTFNNENCIHTFHQVEFMPPLVHKDRVQKTVLYLKLKLGFCAVSRKTNVLQTSKYFASADPQKGLSSCLLLISALKLTQLVELRRKAAFLLVWLALIWRLLHVHRLHIRWWTLRRLKRRWKLNTSLYSIFWALIGRRILYGLGSLNKLFHLVYEWNTTPTGITPLTSYHPPKFLCHRFYRLWDTDLLLNQLC